MNILSMTEGAKRVLQTDPHGLTLTLVAVCVVFGCLLILYFVYSASGDIFSGRIRLKRKHRRTSSAQVSAEDAAAIALALRLENDGALQAAIATAIHLELSGEVHDIEPGVVTIRTKSTSWNDKSLTFRKYPQIKA